MEQAGDAGIFRPVEGSNVNMSISDAGRKTPPHQCRKCKKPYDESAERKRLIDTLIGATAYRTGMSRLELSHGKNTIGKTIRLRNLLKR